MADFVCGANEKDVHLTGVNWERDVQGAIPADLRNVVEGDPSPSGKGRLRIARGIQNKVLEAMAMARPVVASSEAHEGVRAVAGRDLLVADGAEAMAAAVTRVLAGGTAHLGAAARDAVLAGHDWKATLTRLDDILEAASRMKAA